MKYLQQIAAIALAIGGISGAMGAVTAEEAKQLGTTLTHMGAEKAGNKDGSIPAFTNENIKPPADYKPGSGRYPDPFRNEKPILSITAKNMDQYADRLSEGTKLMLKRFPSYRVDVYPTHRTGTYTPWIAENCIKNATRAKTVDGGLGVEGAYGCVPFPIPKSGIDVVWNLFLQPAHVGVWGNWQGWSVDPAGRRSLINGYNIYHVNYLYDTSRTSLSDLVYHKLIAIDTDPPRLVGEQNLLWYSINYAKRDSQAWVYTPGQRRVRLAPEAKYDTPIATSGGFIYYDELNMYSGEPDRYDFKILGKKEMFVPYNTYRALFDPVDKVMPPNHFNPESLRWELHRVWVLEATLKNGKRHAFPKRIWYADEDTWSFLLYDGYDHANKLSRIGQMLPLQMYEGGVNSFMGYSYIFYDVLKGSYAVFDQFGEPKTYVLPVAKKPESFTAPESMAGTGVR